jgi:hypothetical protein
MLVRAYATILLPLLVLACSSSSNVDDASTVPDSPEESTPPDTIDVAANQDALEEAGVGGECIPDQSTCVTLTSIRFCFPNGKWGPVASCGHCEADKCEVPPH